MEEVIIAWHGRVGVTVSESLFVCFLSQECFPDFFFSPNYLRLLSYILVVGKLVNLLLYTYRWKAGEFIVPMIYSPFISETKKKEARPSCRSFFFYNFPPTPISPPRSRPPYNFYK